MPTASGPAKLDVAVEVETIVPAIRRPCAVVEASTALVDAVSVPIFPLSAEIH